MLKHLQVEKASANNYDLQIGNDTVHLGSATGSFTPKMVFPRWQGYAWNTQLGLSMAVTANALAVAGMTSSNTATSVTASNSYFDITYSGVDVNPPYNESGGLDIHITIKKNIGNTLAFAYNNTNVNAYLQPSLTKEWTVGQDLGNGRTVASVTDTDVTDNLGNNVAHRPDYVVNAIAFMNATAGGMVSDVQATTGLTTGQIGMLYRMKMTGANGVTAWADWSIPNGTNLWLNLNTAGMTYPIVISPAGDTFGYTTAGASDYNCGVQIWGGYDTYTPASSGTATSMSIHASKITNTGTDQMALYSYVSSSQGAFVTNGSTPSTSSITTSTWYTASFGTPPSVSSSKSYLAWENSVNNNTQYTSTGGHGFWSHSDTYGTWPGTVATSSFLAYLFSIYCTYTAGGGAVYVPSRNFYPHILAH